jgi:hypothetical protein
MTTFYCLRFETPPTWRVRFPYLYPQLYSLSHWVPFSSPPTIRMATVNVMEPASTRALTKRSLILRPTVSRPVSLGIKHPSGLTTTFLLLSDSCGFVDMGRSLWREDRLSLTIAAGPRQRSHFAGPSPVGLL